MMVGALQEKRRSEARLYVAVLYQVAVLLLMLLARPAAQPAAGLEGLSASLTRGRDLSRFAERPFQIDPLVVRREANRLETSLALARARGDLLHEGRILVSLAGLHSGSADPRAALDQYSLARLLASQAGDRSLEARALLGIGSIREQAGDRIQSLNAFQHAIDLFRQVGQQSSEVTNLINLGSVYLHLHRPRAALPRLLYGLDRARAANDRAAEAALLTMTARAQAGTGDTIRAQVYYDEALTVWQRLGNPSDMVQALVSDLPAAQRHAEMALAQVSRLRHGAAPQAAGLTFAGERAFYQLQVETLMELHKLSPAGGYDISALEVSERSRTGSQSRRALLATIHQARSTSARQVQPVFPNVRQIQSEVLDRDTTLLEFMLGDERSFLWAVTPTSVASFELPARGIIEAEARRVLSLASRSDEIVAGGAAELAARNLARMLLGQVAGQLGDRRLAIVADGALQYVPFGALPAPDRPDMPLIASHAIVMLPSASALWMERRLVAGRTPAHRLVAILADPVFSQDDPRVASPSVAGRPPRPANQTSGAQITDGSARSGSSALFRLPYSRLEAEAIAALAPKGESLLATGFDASRDLVTSGRLAGYRILHFATHGMLDAEQPELSGLVLSQVDRRGRMTNGFLDAQEVSGLSLPADLVVLSACQTALGKAHGEGVMGPVSAFMDAGASRVIAGLWEVNDRATADLLGSFYRVLLHEGMAPAAALRQAEMRLRLQPQYRSPFYWGSFVLYGDWRSLPGEAPSRPGKHS